MAIPLAPIGFAFLAFIAAPEPPTSLPVAVQGGAESRPTKEEFEKRFAAVTKTDVAALLDLANWAENAKLTSEAKRAYRAILDVDPNHELSRAKLGFVKVNGEWVTQEKAKEMEKAKAGDPKKKSPPNPGSAASGRGISVDHDIRANEPGDRAEAQRLKAEFVELPTVVSSAHVSLKGVISREAAIDALGVAEKAYADLSAYFEVPANESVFKAGPQGRLHCIFVKDSTAIRDFIPYFEATYGELDPYLKEDLKKGGGLAAGGQRPVSLTKFEQLDLRTYVLHELGQVYIDALVGGNGAPFLTEGFGIYTAIRWGGSNTTFCGNPDSYSGTIGKAVKGQDTAYQLLAREIATDREDAPLETLAKKKMNQLDDKDLAKCWSLVRMWLEQEPDSGRLFLKLYDTKLLARVAKAAYGYKTLAELDEHWRSLQKK